MINVLQNFSLIKRVFLVAFIVVSLNIFSNEKEGFCLNHNHETSFKFFFCDVCSSTTGGGSFGLGTLNNASFVGVRYVFSSFESKDGIFANSPTTKENFNTYQLWGRVPINERFYVSAILPYQDLTRKFEDRSETTNGFGDATIMGWYKLKLFKKVDKTKAEYVTLKEKSNHTLEFGLGLKLPTGKFEEVLTDRVNPGFQVGTGSTDFIVGISHIYNMNKFGLNNSLTYYLKSENKNEYRFGNQFSYGSNLFYSITKENYNLMPFIGLSGNVYEKIKQFGETISDTDGTVFNGTLGTEISTKNFIIGANYTLPISHNLFGGDVTPQESFSLYLNFALD